MGYYIRVLGTRLNDVPIADFSTAASPALIDLDDRGEPAWQQRNFVIRTPLSAVEQLAEADAESWNLGGLEEVLIGENLAPFI